MMQQPSRQLSRASASWCTQLAPSRERTPAACWRPPSRQGRPTWTCATTPSTRSGSGRTLTRQRLLACQPSRPQVCISLMTHDDRHVWSTLGCSCTRVNRDFLGRAESDTILKVGTFETRSSSLPAAALGHLHRVQVPCTPAVSPIFP